MRSIIQALGTVLFIYVFSSCTPAKKQPLDYEQIADQITAETGRQLKIEKGLILVGIGGGMMNDIQMMAMGFDLYHELSLKEARELITYVAEQYLGNINQSKEVRPYLHNDPFTIKNIEIRIWILKSDRSNVPLGEINYISALKGNVFYYTKELDEKRSFLKETYEEALEIVNNEKNSLPKAS
jgi:hypothetical protein